MSVESCGVVQFKLYLRCTNCRKDSAHMLAVPQVDDAPSDVDELVDSSILRTQCFLCDRCDSPIATLVAVTMPDRNAA